MGFFRVIDYIFSEVDKHIGDGNLISEYKMSALPNLYERFVKLIKCLVISDVLSIVKCFENAHSNMLIE